MAIPTLPPPSAKAVELGERVKAFMDAHIYPAEAVYERQLNEAADSLSKIGRRGDPDAVDRADRLVRAFLRDWHEKRPAVG